MFCGACHAGQGKRLGELTRRTTQCLSQLAILTLDVGYSMFSMSIAFRGTMIPIYVSYATSHIDIAQRNIVVWGERGRGGQA